MIQPQLPDLVGKREFRERLARPLRDELAFIELAAAVRGAGS